MIKINDQNYMTIQEWANIFNVGMSFLRAWVGRPEFNQFMYTKNKGKGIHYRDCEKFRALMNTAIEYRYNRVTDESREKFSRVYKELINEGNSNNKYYATRDDEGHQVFRAV